MIPVVTDCDRCPELCKSRKQIVNGAGSEHPDIVFVGEAPGGEENDEGRPFVGKAGRVLYALCRLAGVDMERVFLTNTCRCWPYKNRTPTSDEIKNCHSHLIEELLSLQPKVIVTLGAPALSGLRGVATTIGSVMGQVLYPDELSSIPYIPTYHPSYIMRGQWDQIPLVVAHLRKAVRAIEGVNTEMGEYDTVQSVEELELLRDLLTDPEETPILSVDTETTGLSWMDDELLCITFSGQVGEGWAVPILHRREWAETTKTPLTHDRAVKLLIGRKYKGERVPLKGISPSEEGWVETWRAFLPYWRGDDYDTVTLDPEILFLEEHIEHGELEPFWEDEDWDRVIELIQEVLGSDIPKAGQNIGFDLGMLEREPDKALSPQVVTTFGFKVNNVAHDTKTASGLLYETLPKNLTVLTSFHTDLPYYEEEVASFKTHMWDCPNSIVWPYGCADTDVVSRVLRKLLPELEEEGSDWVYHNITIPLIRCARKLEQRGVLIDQKYFDKLCGYYTFQVEQASRHLHEVLGRELPNPTYYRTLQKLLWEDLDLPLPPGRGYRIKSAKSCEKCTDEVVCSPGHAMTGVETLEWLMGRSDEACLRILHSLKTLEKLRGTYLNGSNEDELGGFAKHIRADQRIHSHWSPGGTETGRFISQEPNLMNPPKGVIVHDDDFDLHSSDAIRTMFVAPEGKVHMNADWSQLEVWVLAYETGDKTLLDLLRGGEDVHTFVARELCKLGISSLFQADDAHDDKLDNVSWRILHGRLRGKAKVFTFGLSYGLTQEGAATRLGCTTDEAQLLIDAFLGIFPGLRDYFGRIREQLIRYHCVPNKFNRWRHFEEIPVLQALGYQWEIENTLREAVNYPIQSGGHDLHSLAHIMHENTPALVARAVPILELHDSLLMEADAPSHKYVVETAWVVKNSWENIARNTIIHDGSRLGWECLVEVEWGRSFGAPEWKLDVRGKVSQVEEETA